MFEEAPKSVVTAFVLFLVLTPLIGGFYLYSSHSAQNDKNTELTDCLDETGNRRTQCLTEAIEKQNR